MLAKFLGWLGRQVVARLNQDRPDRHPVTGQVVARKLFRRKAFRTKQYQDVISDPAFWAAANEQFAGATSELAQSIISSGALEAGQLVANVNFDLVNQAVYTLAGNYSNQWWQALQSSTRRQLGAALQTNIQSGAGHPALINSLQPLFGAQRAGVIATTEVTRMYAVGNALGYQTAGINQMEWRTSEDELVCPICEPLDGQQFPADSDSRPPAHPNCLTDNQMFVFTAKGNVRFKDLRPGDLVLTHKGRFRPVIEKMRNEHDDRPKVRIIARAKKCNFGLPCTADHPFYTPKGWREAGDLQAGDRVYLGGRTCVECGRDMAPLQKTCSTLCAGRRRARGLWGNPASRAQAVKSVSQANFRSYQNGRDKKKTTEAARAAIIAKYGKLGLPKGAQAKGIKVLGGRHKGSFLERKMAWLLDEMSIPYIRNEQFVVNGRVYYPDFLLAAMNLVIECDGEYWHRHDDSVREADLAGLGLKVLHFKGEEIRKDLAGCARTVERVLANDNHEYGLVEAEILEVRETHTAARASQVTYNLEVAEDHSFIAGGLVVHNCRCWIAPVASDGGAITGDKPFEAPEIAVGSDLVDLLNKMGQPSIYDWWRPGMSTEEAIIEQRALGEYKGSVYSSLNEYLRYAEQRGRVFGRIPVEELKALASTLDEAIARHTIGQDVKLFRGLGEAAVDWEQYPVGSQYIDPAFQSTSVKREFAENWSDVVVEINAKADQPAVWMEVGFDTGGLEGWPVGREAEFLLPRDQPFRVVDKYWRNASGRVFHDSDKVDLLKDAIGLPADADEAAVAHELADSNYARDIWNRIQRGLMPSEYKRYVVLEPW